MNKKIFNELNFEITIPQVRKFFDIQINEQQHKRLLV